MTYLTKIISLTLILLLTACSTLTQTPHGESVFDNQSIPSDLEHKIVFIVSRSDQNPHYPVIGTGSITADHRILTAKHVIDHPYDVIDVYDDERKPLGHFEIDTKGDTRSGNYADHDYAYLRYKSFSFEKGDRGKNYFLSLEGLVDDCVGKSNHITVEQPLGLVTGSSGGPILDTHTHHVLGVLSLASSIDATTHYITTSQAFNTMPMNPEDLDDVGKAPLRGPDHTIGYTAPTSDGPSQRSITHSTDILLPSFPNGFAVLYKGTIEPVTHPYINDTPHGEVN